MQDTPLGGPDATKSEEVYDILAESVLSFYNLAECVGLTPEHIAKRKAAQTVDGAEVVDGDMPSELQHEPAHESA